MCLRHWIGADAAGWRAGLCGVRRDRYAERFRWAGSLGADALELDPFGGALFLFRGKRGDLVKALVWDGQGLVLYAKRLERGRFVWPKAKSGTITLTNAQLSMLLEGIDWRMPAWTARPEVAA
jgi:transposase